MSLISLSLLQARKLNHQKVNQLHSHQEEWQDFLPRRQILGPTGIIASTLGLPNKRRSPRCHHLGADRAWKDPQSSLLVSFPEVGVEAGVGEGEEGVKMKIKHEMQRIPLACLKPIFFSRSCIPSSQPSACIPLWTLTSSLPSPSPTRLTASHPSSFIHSRLSALLTTRRPSLLPLSSPCSSRCFLHVNLFHPQTSSRGHRRRLRRKIKVTKNS